MMLLTNNRLSFGCFLLNSRHGIFILCCFFMFLLAEVSAVAQVIWAVNCGGDAHIDSNGIHYQRDMLKVGQASEHGKSLNIRRVPPQDQLLYQTERYHISNFGYEVPIREDGDYVLVLKFSEVWFTEPNRKVFSVQLNFDHIIIDHLDIFASSGFGIAHDELVAFSIRNNKLYVNDETSSFEGILHIEFVKLNMDNPKINAMYVMKGRLEDAPRLAPLPNVAEFSRPEADDIDDDDSEAGSESSRESKASQERKRRGGEPRIIDPYASDDPSSLLIPVLVAIGLFIPLVFCLCKL